MAEKPMNNFKTAVNDLMNGKIKTEDEHGARAFSEALPDNPGFRAPFGGIPAPATSNENISILSSDIIIEGNVKSKSDIRLNGYIKGDISCGGTIVSTGTIDGNIDSTNITLSNCTVTGNINARGSLSIDGNSSVTGDITGTALVSDGKIKGNIVLKESVALESNATVIGSIKAKSVSIETGTTIVGNMEIKANGAMMSAPVVAAPEPPAKPEPDAEEDQIDQINKLISKLDSGEM